MFSIDIVRYREDKQKLNQDSISKILESGNISILKNKCNVSELERLFSYLNISECDFLKKTKEDEVFRKLCAMKISKNATRQGTTVESIILNGLRDYLLDFGVVIKSLSQNELRPLKTGGVIKGKELKKKGMNKNFDTLKSIDATIGGLCDGYIFAKVLTGNGGHQDNVLREAKEFMEWATKDDVNKLYVVLIDGDRKQKSLTELDKYTKPNVWLCDHVQFQNKILERINDKQQSN